MMLDNFLDSRWIHVMAGGFIGMLFMGSGFLVAWLVYRWFWPPPVQLYFSKLNGVIAVVLANDYDVAVRNFWQRVEAGNENHPGPDGVPRVLVRPVVLFTGSSSHDQFAAVACFLGNAHQYALATEGARLEERKFFVPVNFDGFGSNDIKHFQWLYYEVQGRVYREPPVLPETIFQVE